MGNCKSVAPTAVEQPVAVLPVLTDKNIQEELAKINARAAELRAIAEAELVKVIANNKALDETFHKWRHDIQLRQYALARGVDMRKFDRALRLRREREEHEAHEARLEIIAKI